MSEPRKLAAILAADVAGYSRLTGLDEEGTLKRLRKLRRELISNLTDVMPPFSPTGRCCQIRRGPAQSRIAGVIGMAARAEVIE